MAIEESAVEQYPCNLGPKFSVLSNYLFVYFYYEKNVNFIHEKDKYNTSWVQTDSIIFGVLLMYNYSFYIISKKKEKKK